LQISTTSTTIKDDVRKQIYLQILSDQFCVDRHKKSFLDLVKNKLDIVFAN